MSAPAIVYAAKSTADLKLSIPDQLADGRRLAASKGLTVVAEYQDEAASAYHGDRGAGLAAALAHCERLGAGSALIVQHSDRLARGDGKEARHLIEVVLWAIKNEVELLSVQDPEILAGGDLALLLGAIGGMRNHQDSKRKSLSIRDGRRRRAEKGLSSGHRPYGYVDNHLDAVVPAEVEGVRRIYDETVAGRSQSAIARALNSDGVRTSRGGLWTQTTVRHVLMNVVYKGMVRLNDDVYEGAHEGIVTVETWEAARAIRELTNGYRTKKGRGAEKGGNNGGGRKPGGIHLFTRGLLRCGTCGEAMLPRISYRRNGPNVHEYRCRGRTHLGAEHCDQGPVPRADVDDAILTELTNRYLDVEATRARLAAKRASDSAIAEAARTQAHTEARRAEDRLARVVRAFQDGKLDADDYASQRAGLIAERDAARGAIEDIDKRLESVTKVEDAEVETLLRLAEVRAVVLGEIEKAPDLDALRTLVGQLFVAVYYLPQGHPWIERWRLYEEGPNVAGGAYLIPSLRNGVVVPDPNGVPDPEWLGDMEPVTIRRVPLPLDAVASNRFVLVDESEAAALFAPVPVGR